MGGVDQNMQDTMRYNYVIVLCVWGTRYAVSKLSGGGGGGLVDNFHAFTVRVIIKVTFRLCATIVARRYGFLFRLVLTS